ncbi:hypothetical protein [Veillonella sp. CAG:933]|jgi:hypothetical protein|uniref:hypothetical protein n=1 Tax=Veillonella sp. CAG:933 TaxID=1262980 RepID=UPI000338A97F|nr:hypothetical protein [Veillonella sp. CAG:933]CCX54933.1 putative uncharacterized protein [Veillonella sp. CAG:933]
MSNVFIRSQDREKLYCFGISFNSLQYSEEMEHKRGNKAEKHHAIYIADGCLEKIAEYESKERCIEVLDELQEVCGKYLMVQGGAALIRGGMNVQPGAFEIPRVYEMPEK